MEIEVGEYVRLARNQGINRIIEIEDKRYILDTDIADEFGDNTCVLEEYQLKDEVLDHNKNIIDLVEVGDYVNGCYVEDIFEKGKKIFNTVPESDKGILKNRELCICKPHSYGGIDWIRKEEDIKSIVTHEQFASIEYKVEEE